MQQMGGPMEEQGEQEPEARVAGGGQTGVHGSGIGNSCQGLWRCRKAGPNNITPQAKETDYCNESSQAMRSVE